MIHHDSKWKHSKACIFLINIASSRGSLLRFPYYANSPRQGHGLSLTQGMNLEALPVFLGGQYEAFQAGKICSVIIGNWSIHIGRAVFNLFNNFKHTFCIALYCFVVHPDLVWWILMNDDEWWWMPVCLNVFWQFGGLFSTASSRLLDPWPGLAIEQHLDSSQRRSYRSGSWHQMKWLAVDDARI